MRDFAHSETLACHIGLDEPDALDTQARQAVDLMRARLDHAYGAPETCGTPPRAPAPA